MQTLVCLAQLRPEHFTYISSFNPRNNQRKLKTTICFEVEVLESGRVNCFVQDLTASVNSKGGSELLSEAQTKPFLSHLTKHCIRTAEGAEPKADMLWTLVR